VGRLIAVVLFIAVLVPGVLLSRAWWLAADQRAVAAAAVEFATPSETGNAVLRRQALHARRVRRLGWLLGLIGIAVSVVLFAEASVFLWVPALVIGLLIGVLLAVLLARFPRSTRLRPFLAVGVLGGYTTYSTFAVDTVRLGDAGAWAGAVGYVLSSVLGGATCVLLGLLGARALLHPSDTVLDELEAGEDET